MPSHDLIGTRMGLPKGTPFSWREELIVRALMRAFTGDHIVGRLRLTLPSGRTEVFGRSGDEADVVLGSLEPFWRGLTRGALGVAECYLDGTIQTADLGRTLRFLLTNSEALSELGYGVMKSRLVDRVWHKRRANTRTGSRRNIAAHYDLGNDFYRLWLDPSMTYSSALFDGSTVDLEQAQLAKNEAILNSLDVRGGDRVLEIGCGWGGFMEAAARRGCHVTGITLSKEQLAWAQRRMGEAGFAGQCEIAFCDYRDLTGTFDKIASVEMIEAVGEENWPVYFKTLHDRLRPGGVGVIQAITIDERYYAAYRREPDFIQRYIFPGGMLPTVGAMARNSAQAGLTFEVVQRFGGSYAQTLADWRTRFDAAWPHIAALGFDERFRRMWGYYLTYCEVGFEKGDIDVGLYKVSR